MLSLERQKRIHNERLKIEAKHLANLSLLVLAASWIVPLVWVVNRLETSTVFVGVACFLLGTALSRVIFTRAERRLERMR